jgi:hypothetical protein
MKSIAETILDQLGGNKFVVATGSKNLVADKNRLIMTLSRNKSKANRLEISLNGLDTYDMRFFKFTPFKFDANTMTMREEKLEDVKILKNIYCDQLQEIFTHITGLITKL